MLRTVMTWLPAGCLLLLFGASLGLGCMNDDLEGSKRRRPSSNPIGMPDALPEEDAGQGQPENCPESLPKEGETCPTVTRANITCSYAARLCPNEVDSVSQSMCCGRGSVWVPCGTYDPCPVPEVDAGL
jgi:hypothetical protein